MRPKIFLSIALALTLTGPATPGKAAKLDAAARRIVEIKVDGLPEDAIERNIDQLPWIRRVFAEQGAWVRNFYVRGISLSAPSWSMLDTGQHTVIRGNAEFDRFTSGVYDYLNFFPFYVGYARSRREDMPGVEVLDQAGIPLVSDQFPRSQRYDTMELYQRGVHWETLAESLRSKIALPVKGLLDEWQTGFDMSGGIERQQEKELIAALADPRVVWLEYFTGDVDHAMHLTNDPASQLIALKRLDATIGRVWTAIGSSVLASETTMVLISDHGMNSTPDVYSQGYNLVRFFNSDAGGGHHVISIRQPLGDYKLRALDPFTSTVNSPSQNSFYLRDQKDWSTAMLDLDGNERASIQLRNSDLNEIQILFQELGRAGIRGDEKDEKEAVSARIIGVVDRNREAWSRTVRELGEELPALARAITLLGRLTQGKGEDSRRSLAIRDAWLKDYKGYGEYAKAIQRLLDLKTPDLTGAHAQFPLPKNVLGESNTIAQLAGYVVGPAGGPPDNFIRVNYFKALTDIQVPEEVQAGMGLKPVDFVAAPARDGVFLYTDERHGALIESRTENGEQQLRYVPVCDTHLTPAAWGDGYPLRLFEDPALAVSGDRKAWLSQWHSEREWLEAVHRTRYSNAVIGLAEYFETWKPAEVPAVFRIAPSDDWPLLQRFGARMRRVVQPDMLVLAQDHWNFNVRGFNPGGNHGSFFRISTRSVFMAAGAGVATGVKVDRPYDSLSFVPTLLELMNKLPENTYPGPVIQELLPAKQTSSYE